MGGVCGSDGGWWMVIIRNKADSAGLNLSTGTELGNKHKSVNKCKMSFLIVNCVMLSLS